MLMICSKLGVCFCPSVLSPNFLDSAVIHALISGAVVDYPRGLAFSAFAYLKMCLPHECPLFELWD